MIKSYKYRLYPNKQQCILLEKHFGSCRFVYNTILNLHNILYLSHGEIWDKYKYIRFLTLLKNRDELSWLKEVNSTSLQQSIFDLDHAFRNFFKRRVKYPVFKSKNKSKKSFRVYSRIKANFDINKIFIAKFREGIKCKFSRIFKGKIKNATVLMTKTGKYYISIVVDDCVDIENIKNKSNKFNSIGIDVGLINFVTFSDGYKIKSLDLNKYIKKIDKLNHKLSKKKKGSNNREKIKTKLLKLYEKVSNIKKDFLHKLSKSIVDKNHIDYIFIEDLNIKCMMKNHGISRSIALASWYQFFTYLKYKAENKGKYVIQIDRYFPSSKLCSICGYKNDTLMLVDREWVCPNCKTKHDRDINAAINIRDFGINTVGTTEI